MRWRLPDVAFLNGLPGAFVASSLALGLGLVVHRAGGPGLVTVASALLLRELIRGESSSLADRIVERLMRFADALVIALLAIAADRLHANEIDWGGEAMGLGLLLVVLLTLSSIVASALVERLDEAGPWLHRAAIVALVGVSGAVGLALRHGGIPKSYVIGALIGFALGLAAVERAMKHHRRGRALARALEGTMDDRGWVTFADGAVPVRPDETDVRIGPGRVVVVLRAIVPNAPGYRTMARSEIDDIQPGTLDGNRHAARLHGACDDALALGAVALTSAPLMVALMTMSRR